jgi:agmatinase
MSLLSEQLKMMLRPAGGGVYVISTGLKEQRELQRQIYRAEQEQDIIKAWHQTIDQALDYQSVGSGNRVMLLGVPSDTGAGFTRGANLAPAAIRAYLMRDQPQHPLIGSASLDIGDVRVVPQLLSDEMLSDKQIQATQKVLYGHDYMGSELPVSPLDICHLTLSQFAQEERKYALTPIVIGGDHSVGWPAFKAAFERWESSGKARLGLLHFDAHTDLLSERLGVKYCFATWAWHANQLLGADGRLVQVGIRASGRDQAYWEKSCNLRQFWSAEVKARGVIEIAHEIIDRFESLGVTALYVSNDIDGTDSAYASATGTPEPNGLTPDQVDEITRLVGARFPLIGADLVEVAPPLSSVQGEPEMTLKTTAKYLETLATLSLSRMPII